MRTLILTTFLLLPAIFGCGVQNQEFKCHICGGLPPHHVDCVSAQLKTCPLGFWSCAKFVDSAGQTGSKSCVSTAQKDGCSKLSSGTEFCICTTSECNGGKRSMTGESLHPLIFVGLAVLVIQRLWQ